MTPKGIFRALLSGGVLAAGIAGAHAHPHVLVSVRTAVVLNDAGEIAALRHAWKFDEAFSTFSTAGLDKNKDGKLDRAELADLAKVNVESLHEYTFFSFLRKNTQKSEFGAVKDYWLAHDGKNLTLHFTLPVSGALFPVREARLEVYDPTYFVAFEFEKEQAVTVEGSRLACTATLSQPAAGVGERLSKLSESFFQSLNAQGANGNADWAVPVRFSCK